MYDQISLQNGYLFLPHQRHWPWWLWELYGRLRQAAVRQARPPWDSGDWHSTHAQGACECPRPDQTSLHSGVALLLQSSDLSMSAWWHHLDERNPVGQQSPGQVAYHQHSKYQPLWRECPHWNQRQQRHHYFGETQWTPHLQKPVCRQLLHWEVECRIVQGYCFRTPQHNHHFGEALYASCQQKPACSIFPAPAVECRLVQTNYSHKQWPNHRFGEGLYDPRLQRPGCMTFRHPAVECRIVHPHYYRMRQHCHHCGEAPYGSCLQKPGCRTCLHPKVEFGIVPLHHPRKPQHFHHFGEALYVRSQQTPVCMTLLNLKVELHIARPGCLRKPQHGHHFGEALCDSRLQKPGCRTFPHLSAEYHIVHAHYLRKPQHCHHSGEAPCGCSLQKPLPPRDGLWEQTILHILGQSFWIVQDLCAIIIYYLPRHVKTYKLFKISAILILSSWLPDLLSDRQRLRFFGLKDVLLYLGSCNSSTCFLFWDRIESGTASIKWIFLGLVASTRTFDIIWPTGSPSRFMPIP